MGGIAQASRGEVKSNRCASLPSPILREIVPGWAWEKQKKSRRMKTMAQSSLLDYGYDDHDDDVRISITTPKTKRQRLPARTTGSTPLARALCSFITKKGKNFTWLVPYSYKFLFPCTRDSDDAHVMLLFLFIRP